MAKIIKVARSAGHGLGTAGKRTPDGEREWSFNTLMSEGFAEELDNFEGVQQKLVSDSTGKRDVPLTERTDIANDWGADYYFSFHHNANNGKWGTHTGTETYTHDKYVNQVSLDAAKIAQNAVVKIYKLRDRGLKRANFHELRVTKMPAVLVEGGYMDSTIDIKVMRDKNKVKEAGRQVARDFAASKGLKRKSGTVTKPSVRVSGTIYRVQVGAFSRLDNAVNFAAEVENKTGFDTYLVDADKVTRVQVGAFSVKGNAEKRLSEMKSKGYKDAFITTNGTQAIAEAEPYNELEKPKVIAPAKKHPLPNATYWVKSPLFSGAGVRQVQEALASIYFYPEKGAKNNGIDGYYGAKTADAVKRFQSVNGLKADGKYGPATRKALDKKVNE